MSLWFVNVAGPSFSQRDGFCVEKFCSNQYRFIVGLCVWWAAAISGLSSPKMSSLMCCMWTDRRAEQWKGSLECLGFPCWDGSSRGWRPMWGQLLHIVQPLIIHQRFKYEEHVIVIFTFVYFLDWSCYRNGHEFDWPQRVYGGNGMLDAYLCCLLNIIFDGPLFTSPTKYHQRSYDLASGIGRGSGVVVGGTSLNVLLKVFGWLNGN